MPQPQFTYSFLDVQATLTGPAGTAVLGNNSGASEEGISVEPVEEKDVMHIGADGSGAHSLHASKAGKVTIRLLKTSPTNILLTEMYNFQTSSSLFHGRNILVITHIINGEVYTCTGVAFARFANDTYAKDAGIREWIFNAIAIEPGGGILRNV
jgi:hypothetical protein